jgi:hypothetical protein
MRQVLAVLAVLFVAPLLSKAEAAAEKPQHFARLLARECDALIDAAIKRPYGWAWGEADAEEGSKPPARRDRIPVSIGPLTSPAAGLVLLHASELLHEPKYAEAARKVGNGLAATQQPRGNLPAVGMFGATSGQTVSPVGPLTDRAPTRAALALLLSLVEADPNARDATSRAAPRAAQWLLRQQAETGSWPVMYPPGAPPQEAIRLVRLDTPDTRDSVVAMLLAYEVLGDAAMRRSAERSLDFLVKFRGNPSEPGAGLWRSAYIPSGLTVDKLREFPPGFDALAARYTVQAFFASWVVLGDERRLAAAELATKSLDEFIKGNDGQWRRRFALKSATTAPTAPSTSPAPTPGAGKESDAKGDPGWPRTAQAVAVGRLVGREKYREQLAAGLPLNRRLALTLAGLSDSPMQVDLPGNPEEAAAYLKEHGERLRQIEGSTPPDLGGRVEQLWSLYLRAWVEQKFGI